MKKVCVLGSGAFGTAMACLLADNGHEVNIWCCEPDVVESINLKNINNMYLPDIKLSENILAFTDLGPAIADCEIIFEAVPVKYLRSVLEQAKPYFNKQQIWACCSKGIENETLLFPSQIIDSIFCSPAISAKSCQAESNCVSGVFSGEGFINCVKKVVISGPSFARELALKQITAVDLASQDKDLAVKVAQVLDNDYFKTVITSDIFGVQIGGALKNVAAIGVGMLDGMGCKENTKALFFNLCLQEMAQMAQVFGAQKETICGLSGIGDLIATCAGGSSKNFKFGHNLACAQACAKGAAELGDSQHKCGLDMAKILELGSKDGLFCSFGENMAVLPEGVNTAKSVYQIIKLIKNLEAPEFKLNHHIFFGDNLFIKEGGIVSFPILEAVHDVIFGHKSVQDLVLVLKNK